MRRIFHSSGFWLCFLVNLIFRGEWLLAALAAFFLHLLFHITIIPAFILLGMWVLVALVITLFLGWANRLGHDPTPPRHNMNPYSHNNTDFLPERPPENAASSENTTRI